MKWYYYLIIGILIIGIIVISSYIESSSEKEDVTITTDKIEYSQGENISITIKNNMNQNLNFYIGIMKFIENKWIIINAEIRCQQKERINEICAECNSDRITIESGEIYNIIWDQTICYKELIGKFKVILFHDDNYFSNEFEIRECLTDSNCENLDCPLVGKPNLKPECVNNTCKCTYSWCMPACR